MIFVEDDDDELEDSDLDILEYSYEKPYDENDIVVLVVFENKSEIGDICFVIDAGEDKCGECGEICLVNNDNDKRPNCSKIITVTNRDNHHDLHHH